MYVVETDTSWLTVSKNEVRASLQEIGEDAGAKALAEIEALAAEFDVELVTELREGTPDEEIVEYVDDEAVDLVVMGTHGREGIRRRLVGSVAERVVREAPVPVTTVTDAGDTEQ
ncbi:universal stress protein [Natronoarchaeum philippinense]|uniref:universal stress protein n=1 Tax=Natronoarchaeum philippinense TaxID=558529 RepID=UPI002872D8E6|nr:universal stress protein [Natronoarchaeum philippinense]